MSKTSLVGFGDYEYDVDGQSANVQRGLALLGHACRQARRRTVLSQRALEDRSGVDQTVISRLENGRLVSLRLVRLAALIDALDGLGLVGAPRPKRTPEEEAAFWSAPPDPSPPPMPAVASPPDGQPPDNSLGPPAMPALASPDVGEPPSGE